MIPSKTNVVIELEIKRGIVMKKSENLHNYVPVTLVLLSDKLMIFYNNTFSSPDCSIPISQLLSASILAEPSISFYLGISQDYSFCTASLYHTLYSKFINSELIILPQQQNGQKLSFLLEINKE
jgi:hypothetical protein